MTSETGTDILHRTRDSQPRAEEERKMTNVEVFDRTEELMHDKSFLVEVADKADKAYRESEIDRLTRAGQTVEDWLTAPLFLNLNAQFLFLAQQKVMISKQKF